MLGMYDAKHNKMHSASIGCSHQMPSGGNITSQLNDIERTRAYLKVGGSYFPNGIFTS